MWVAALVFFVAGALGGFFLTALPIMSPNDWRYWIAGRIVWQLGGAIWFGAAVCAPLDAPKWKGAALGALFGAILCFQPLLDLALGPLELEGQVVQVNVWQGRAWRQYGAYSTTTHAQIELEGEAKQSYRLKLSGRQVQAWAERFSVCHKNQTATRVLVLRHLQNVIELVCETTQGKPGIG